MLAEPRVWTQMDDELKKYRSQLERAIHDALTESAAINSIIYKIQETGYDVFLIIEATIGFHQPEDGETEQSPKFRLKLTSQDERFLRQLKISPE